MDKESRSCPACHAQIPTDSETCPSCGKSATKSTSNANNIKNIMLGVLLFFGAVSWVALLQDNGSTSPPVDPRRERIESQFSPFSGAHRNLVRAVEAAMHDPDSFEHVETGFADEGNSLRVRMVYRGANAFGGIVRQQVVARVSLDGEIMEIIEQ